MIRCYISNYVLTGQVGNPEYPIGYRADFHLILEQDPTVRWGGMDNPHRQHYVARLSATQATHDAIIAQGKGVPVSPLFADEAEEEIFLDAPVAGMDSTLRNSVQTALENAGYNTNWIQGTHTFRNIAQYFWRVTALAQRIHGENHAGFRRLLSLPLNGTVADLTGQERTAVRNWMTNKGWSVTWITNATTIRAVIHFVVLNLNHRIRVMRKDF
jgi:hypothetical protein